MKAIDQLNGSSECTPSMRMFFDASGRLTEKHYLHEGNIGNRFLYRYNNLGQLIESKTLIYPSDSNSIDYEYDAAGNIRSLQCYYRGAKTEKWCYSYNQQNQKTAEYRVAFYGDTISTYHYTYSGNKPDLEKYYTGKQLRYVCKYQYDRWGNETGKKFIKGDMRLPFPSTLFSGPDIPVKHTYFEGDKMRVHSTKTITWEANRVAQEELIDSTGKTIYTGQFHYNTDGLIHEITSFSGSSANNLNEYYTYDKNDRLITKHSTFNGQENQRTEFLYDSLGRNAGFKRFYQGKLQESTAYSYNGRSSTPESERTQHQIYNTGSLHRMYEYTDTMRTAVYSVTYSAVILPDLFATQPRYRTPELLWEKPPTALRPDNLAFEAPFWYDTIGKPLKKVVGTDTIITMKLAVYRWMMDESDPQPTTVIQRTEVLRNGLQQLTDRDSTGRIQVQLTRISDGSYEFKKLESYTVSESPIIRKTYAMVQLYSSQPIEISYYNTAGLVDSIRKSGAAEVTQFRYDAKNKLIEKVTRYSSNFISTTLYVYNSDGQLIRETLFSTDGSISNDRHYTYEHKKLKQVTSSMPAPVQTYRFYYEK